MDEAVPADRNFTQREQIGNYRTLQEFVCRVTANVDRELFDHTGNNWSHRNSDKIFKEKFGTHTRKILIRFTQEVRCSWEVTFDTKSIAV